MRDVAISPDERWLATSSTEKIRVWDLQNLEAAPSILDGTGMFIAFSNQGYCLVVDTDKIEWWDLAIEDSATSLYTLKLHDWVNNITASAISPDGNWLVTGSRDNTIQIRGQSPTLLATWRGHEADISAIVFSPDKPQLVTAGTDGTIRLWNMTALSRCPPMDANISAVHHILGCPKSSIEAMAIDSDNRWLVTGNYDNTAQVWDLQNLEADPHVLKGHRDSISTVAISSDGYWLATGSIDKTVQLWNLRNLELEPYVLVPHGSSISGVAFSPDGRWLAAGSQDKLIRIWDLQNLEAVPRILEGHKDGIIAISISPDGQWLVTGGIDKKVLIWNMQDWTAKPHILSGHEKVITSLVISPDSHWLVTVSYDATARVWDLKNLDAKPRILHEHKMEEINTVAISSDGRWLAIGSDSGNVQIWDFDDLDVAPWILRVSNRYIKAITFSPDGRWLITGGDGNVVRLWPMQIEEVVEWGCQTVGRNLTWIEWELYFTGQEYRRICPELPIRHTDIAETTKQAHALVQEGKLDTALSAYTQAVQWAVETSDVSLNASACWYGTRDGFAETVAPACARVAKLGTVPVSVIQEIVDQAHTEAEKENKDVAALAYSQATNWAIETDNADTNSRICAFGTIDGFAETVTLACKHAAELGPVSISVVYEVFNQARYSDHTNNTEAVRYAYTQATQWAIETESLDLNSSICTNGNADGFAEIVAPACNHALELALQIENPYSHLAIFNLGSVEELKESLKPICNHIVELAMETEDASLLNGICWFGSVDGFATTVLPACDRAIDLAPEDGNARDSRGLARALTGDYTGAVEDFEFFVEWSKKPDSSARNVDWRETWIVELKAGRNPFDDETLERLAN